MLVLASRSVVEVKHGEKIVKEVVGEEKRALKK